MLRVTKESDSIRESMVGMLPMVVSSGVMALTWYYTFYKNENERG